MPDPKKTARTYLNIGHSFMTAMRCYQMKCMHSVRHDWQALEAMGDLVQELEQLFEDAKRELKDE